jgi:hypothetical protein
MKSSKWMIGLVAVVLMLALAPSSFAQVTIQIFNTPSSQEITTNRHANTSDITSPGAGIQVTGSVIALSSLTTTTLTLTFPAPITSSPNALDGTIAGALITKVPSTADAIRIEGATGLFASVTAIASVNYVGGTITLTLPGFPPPTGNVISGGGSFRLSGVRLDINGRGPGPLAITQASLSSSANNYIAPSTLPQLITSTGNGLGAFSQATLGGGSGNGTSLLFANQNTGTPADAVASILLTEGFTSAWRSTTQTATTGVGADIPNGSNIQLTISGLPSGVTATFSRITIAGQTAPGISPASGFTMTSAATSTTLSFTSTDLTAVESAAYDIALSFTGGGPTLPIAAGSITLSATMAPTSAAAGLPTLTGGVPRFLSTAATNVVTIGTIGQANTTLLLPYAARAGIYDTGIAIANTTKDPFTTGGAAQAPGTIRFDLFPRSITGSTGAAGTQTTIQTSASVKPGTNGGGLDASGQIPAGGTWSATLSELMAAASPAVTGDFVGYLFIQTNFIGAHGVSYIMESGRVAGTVPLLVLDPPAGTPRGTTSKESLSF